MDVDIFLSGPGLRVLHIVDSAEVNLLDAYLLVFADGEIHADGTLHESVALCLNVDRGVVVALLIVEPLYDVRGSLGNIVGEYTSRLEVQPFLQVLLITTLYAGEGPTGNAGPLGHADLKEGRITRCIERIDCHGNILKITPAPHLVDEQREEITRDSHLHSFAKAACLDNLILVHVIVSLNGDSADNIFLRIVVIHRHSGLRPRHSPRKDAQKGNAEQES